MLTALLLFSLSGDVPLPQYDVDVRCWKRGMPIHNEDARRQITRECVENEQASYDILKSYWEALGDREKTRCLSNIDRLPYMNYALLQQCLAGYEDLVKPIPQFER